MMVVDSLIVAWLRTTKGTMPGLMVVVFWRRQWLGGEDDSPQKNADKKIERDSFAKFNTISTGKKKFISERHGRITSVQF